MKSLKIVNCEYQRDNSNFGTETQIAESAWKIKTMLIHKLN